MNDDTTTTPPAQVATAAQRKAAERARHKAAGRVAVTVHIWPQDREHLARYILRLNERRRQAIERAERDKEAQEARRP